jgi:hypothetical protein
MGRPTKRLFFWIFAPLILFLVFLIVLHILLTRVINQQSIKNRIAAAVSKKLGGRVGYDWAAFSLFPRPRVMIRGLNILMPENLSGSMNALDIYPELWPLITGKLVLDKVRLDQPNVHFALPGKTGHRADSEKPPASSEQNLATALGFVASQMSIVEIFIEQGRLSFDQDDQRLFTLQEVESKITFASTAADAKGVSGTSLEEPFRLIGNIQGFIAEGEQLPKTFRFTVTQFEVLPLKISISDARIQVLDSSFSGSGSLDNYLSLMPKADLILNGKVGPEMMQWIRTIASLPPELSIHTPVNVSQAHLSWSRGGTTELEGSASVEGDLNLLYDVSWESDRFAVKNFRIRDQTSQAELSLGLEKRVLNLAFSGNLTQSLLNRLFEHERFRFGWVRGNLRARVALDRPMESTVHGTLEGEQLVLPIQIKTPIIVNRVSLKAADRTVTLSPVIFTLGDKRHTVNGKITALADRWLIDLTSDGLEWESLQPLFSHDADREGEESRPSEKTAPVQATVRLSTAYFSAGRWTVSPARAEIMLGADGISISLSEAVVCGVNLPGMVTFVPGEISLDLKPSASRQDLESSFVCLFGEENRVTGAFDLSGHLTATGAGQTLLKTLQGNIAFTAKDGRMFGTSVVVRTLMFLNVNDLMRGNYPDPGKNGVPYKSMTLQGTIQKGIFSIGEAVLTSPVVQLAGRGSLSLLDRTIDLTVLAAPFTTTDSVIKKIPLVRDILGNSLVTFPIRISGDIENPKFESIPPSAVAEGIVSMMGRTLGLPFKIIDPIIPDLKTR